MKYVDQVLQWLAPSKPADRNMRACVCCMQWRPENDFRGDTLPLPWLTIDVTVTPALTCCQCIYTRGVWAVHPDTGQQYACAAFLGDLLPQELLPGEELYINSWIAGRMFTSKSIWWLAA